MLIQYLKADFLKTKRLSLPLAHILIPIGTAVLFIAYYTYSPWSELMKIDVFYQVLGTALPVLIGVFCSVLAEQEYTAGAFQSLLIARKKYEPFLSKLIVLLLWALGALLLASTLFGLGFHFVLGNYLIPISFYLFMPLLLLGSSIVLYLLHLFLAFRFNRGVSLGLGIGESLVSALFLTDMGKYAWQYVPASWPARMSTTFLSAYTGDVTAEATLHTMLPVWAAFTFAAIVFYIIWASRWEGTKNSD